MREEQDRAGRFFLKARGKNRIQYICWYDKATRQTTGVSTGTADLEEARKALYEHALKFDQPVIGTDAQLAAVMQSYFIHYAQHLPSAHVQRAAQRDALEIWGDPDISELNRAKQLELVSTLRGRGLSDWTIDSRLNRIWAAMNWHKRDHAELVVPEQITAEDWKPVLEDCDRTYSIEELGTLFNAAAEAPENVRYTREHWWRFLVLAVGTAAREAAIRELTVAQIDLAGGRIRLNPEGRRQTKKRRPIIPIAPTVAAELASWQIEGEHVITYYGKPLATPEFFDLLAEKSSVGGSPKVIRHTVRTWLAEYGVPDSDADMFMGHKGRGSATGARYTHRRPEYLRTVIEAIEALFDELSVHVRRPFAGRVLNDQPSPDDPICEALRGECVATEVTELRKCLNSGAGNETRTRDPDLGKTPVLLKE